MGEKENLVTSEGEAQDPSTLKPYGDILKDRSSGTDYLGYNVYADALVSNIGKISTPMTIGMFGSWGSGKSFLLNKVKVLLALKNQKQSLDDNDCCCTSDIRLCCSSRQTRYPVFFVLSLVLLALFVLGGIFIFKGDIHGEYSIFTMCLFANNNTTDVNNVTSSNATIQLIKQEETCNYAGIIMLSIAIFIIFFLTCVSKMCWSKECCTNFWIVLYAAFTKLPNKLYKRSEHQTRYIFVNFNAWQYAGSDMLWAGIVTNLSNAIEDEFGCVTSRLFRMLSESKITHTRLFAKFPETTKQNIEEDMKVHGVVLGWEGLNKEQSKEWWTVRFSNLKEEKPTTLVLENHCIEFNFTGPTNDEKTNKQNNSSDTCKCSKCCQNLIEFVKLLLQYPKTTCCFPNILLWLLVVTSIFVVPIAVYHIVSRVELEVYKTGRKVSAVVQFLAWLPSSFVALYMLFKIVWAMLHSQTKRIMSTLKGTKGAMSKQLGIMDKIKQEVEYITKLVKCAGIVHNKEYKVVIFIDDLDRVALDKVKSILESVNILLSDESSPFVCIIAVDSRIAVKSIEENKESGLQNSKISGHEYLKKIINLPFCLPEISEEKKESLVHGLIYQTTKLQNNESNDASKDDQLVEDYKISAGSEPLNHQEFIIECRNYFHSNESIRRYLHGNPRNIKRIFNVISLTSSLIQCYDKLGTSLSRLGSTQSNSIPVKRSKNLAEDLVIWIILTDQWPCIMNCLLQIMEDTDKENKSKQPNTSNNSNNDSNTSLLVFYRHYVQEKCKILEKDNLSSLDAPEKAFQGFLNDLDDDDKNKKTTDTRINKKNLDSKKKEETVYKITKGKAKVLKELTINLDHCIRQTICQVLN